MGLGSLKEKSEDNLREKFIVSLKAGEIPTLLETLPENLRDLFLIRHQFVAWPLLEYSEEKFSLVNVKLRNLSIFVNKNKLVEIQKKAPRFIHLDEIKLNNLLEISHSKVLMNRMCLRKCVEGFEHEKSLKKITNSKDDDWNIRQFSIDLEPDKENGDKFCVGIANINVKKEDVEASYHPGNDQIYE